MSGALEVLSARYIANSLGPELAFGATMHEKLQEPILIIKTAWGGKSLHTDFRPPGAGGDKDEKTGHFYRLMMDHVKKVLADPGQYHPAYNKDDGYELAGFVWFQGWNDVTDGKRYPNRGSPGSYDAYTKVLGDLIRDVRGELGVPKLPFVIGVLGVNGSYLDNSLPTNPYTSIHTEFPKAMAATAGQPEFQGNVFAVHTGLYWDPLPSETESKKWKVRKESTDLVKQGELKPEDQMMYKTKRLAEILTPEEAIAYRGIPTRPPTTLEAPRSSAGSGKPSPRLSSTKRGTPNRSSRGSPAPSMRRIRTP